MKINSIRCTLFCTILTITLHACAAETVGQAPPNYSQTQKNSNRAIQELEKESQKER